MLVEGSSEERFHSTNKQRAWLPKPEDISLDVQVVEFIS